MTDLRVAKGSIPARRLQRGRRGARTVPENHFLFLSHAGADSAAALRLAQRLEQTQEAKARGLVVWIDKKDLAAGDGWKKQLEEALERSTAFAVYVGSNGVMNWVRDEVNVALDRGHKDSRYPIVPVISKHGDVAAMPGFLGQYQGVVDVENDADAFARLVKSILRLVPRSEVDLEVRPFQGLGAFTTHRAHLFRGRDTETNDLVKLLYNERLVMVVGDSGSGKSSLIEAGLVPAFLGGALAGSAERTPDETVWHAVKTRAGSNPFRNLADALAAAAESVGRDPHTRKMIRVEARSEDRERVRDALIESAPPGAKILLVVDQFEELLTLSAEAARKPYVEALMSMADPADDRIRIVLGMRRDYYNLTSEFETFYERLEQAQARARYFLRKMTDAGLREAVEAPLCLAGVNAARSKALADVILRDVGDQPSDLALLEMALTKTWDTRQSHDNDLLRAYHAIGRVDGALANAAEDVFNGKSPKEGQLTDDERTLAEVLFIRLVRLGDTGGTTRRIAARNEFDARTWTLAQKLSQAPFERLVVIGGSENRETAEIAHEALVTQWPRYQRWLQNREGDRRADDKRRLDRLTDLANGWEAAKEDRESLLATGSPLDQFTLLAKNRLSWLSALELAYLKRSAERDGQARVARELENEFITKIVDSDRLRQCLEKGESLWPAHPEKVEALEELKAQATELLETVPDKTIVLNRLKDSLGQAVTPRLRWQSEVLHDLIAKLESLGEPTNGLVADVERRLTFARTVRQQSIEDCAATWDATIAEIRSSEKYRGLDLEPQIGLVPLGKDPLSGLFEFLHTQTHAGPLPTRDGAGRLSITEETGIVLVLLPGGSFWMGAQNESRSKVNFDKSAETSEMPPHLVTLDPFYLSKNLMTQGQWVRFARYNPSHYQPGFQAPGGYQYTYLHPVEEVSWSECKRLLEKLDLSLPTEAQWEYAARAGTSTAYWTGDDEECILRGAHLLYNKMKLPRHAPVGSYEPNGFGLHDVIGNLWEFTADGYGPYNLQVREGDGRREVNNDYLVIRGCSFFNSAEQARIAYRTDDCKADKRESWMGVRPARSLGPLSTVLDGRERAQP